MKMLRSFRFWIGIAISGLCLWLAFRSVPLNEFAASLSKADLIWLAPSVLVQLAAVLPRAKRWAVILRKKGIVWDAYWAHSVGFLFTNVLPLRMGEPARILVLAEKAQIPILQVAASVLVERILDVATVILGLVLVLPFMQVPEIVTQAGLSFGAIILLAMIVLVFVVRFRQLSERWLMAILNRLRFLPAQLILRLWKELVEGLAPILNWRTGLEAFLWSILGWIGSIGIYWFAMRAYEPNPGLVESVFVVVALALAITIPSSPGFIGVFQYAGLQALVLPFHGKYSESLALAIVITAYLVYYVITTLLGVIGLWRAGESFGTLVGRLTKLRSTEG